MSESKNLPTVIVNEDGERLNKCIVAGCDIYLDELDIASDCGRHAPQPTEYHQKVEEENKVREDKRFRNKGNRARRAAYNEAYAEFVRKAEGVDEGILVTAHSFAAWHRDHHFAECKCYGSGTYWVRAEGFETHGKYVIERCFGCNGKGYQDRDDQKRNWGYWNFYARIEA